MVQVQTTHTVLIQKPCTGHQKTAGGPAAGSWMQLQCMHLYSRIQLQCAVLAV